MYEILERVLTLNFKNFCFVMASMTIFSNTSSAKILPYPDVLALDREKGIAHDETIDRWKSSSPIPFTRLKVVTFSYIDFEGHKRDDGEIVVMDAVAPRIQKIFEALLSRKFPIAKARRMEFYQGADEASMNDNNTSGYNSRSIIGESSDFSLHAYGLAVDINPIQNPFHFFKTEEDRAKGLRSTSPTSSALLYINRSRAQADHRPGLAEEILDLFKSNGFTIWGGDWNDPIDWQHFQTSRGFSRLLTEMRARDAEEFFEKHAEHPKLMTEIQSDEKTFIRSYRQDPEKFMKIFRENPRFFELSPREAVKEFYAAFKR